MPAHITHSIFGSLVKQKYFDNNEVNTIKLNNSAFEWGLQGPDIMFFSVICFGGKLNSYGSIMHRDKIDELFSAMQNHIKALSEKDDFEIAFSYLCGFCCHYILDKNCHPYVYDMQYKREKENSKIHGHHFKIESDIDSFCADKYFNLTPRKFAISQALLTDKHIWQVITHIYVDVLKSVYNITVSPRHFTACFKGGRVYYKLIIASSFKMACAKLAEFVSCKKGAVTAHLRVENPDASVLNNGHNSWKNNSNGEESSLSFFELFEKSLPEAAQTIKALSDNICYNAENNLTNGISFDNGSLNFY